MNETDDVANVLLYQMRQAWLGIGGTPEEATGSFSENVIRRYRDLEARIAARITALEAENARLREALVQEQDQHSKSYAVLAGEIARLREGERELKTALGQAERKAALADEAGDLVRKSDLPLWWIWRGWLARYDALTATDAEGTR